PARAGEQAAGAWGREPGHDGLDQLGAAFGPLPADLGWSQELDAQLSTALEGLDPAAAQQAVAESTVALDGLLAQLGIDQATAAQLAGLLEQAALACGAAPAAPVPAAPAPVAPFPAAPAPVVPAPAVAAPVAAPVEAAPVAAAPVEEAPAAPGGVNPGFDVQTAADARPSGFPLLLAGAGGLLLAAAATVLVRRRARA
ncbi:hypothetical protein MRU69_06555, partial [Kocuria flava]|nr:hypothetical protein [Kocuria flava]